MLQVTIPATAHKSRIYKRGGKNLRNVLYMCSMNAMKTNTACKTLYERLRANGKTGKQALIAVCNKLLKQVFAVVKTTHCINQITVLLNHKKV